MSPATERLREAARLRDSGTTWSAIREQTGLRLRSTDFRRAWQAAGIPAPASDAPENHEAERISELHRQLDRQRRQTDALERQLRDAEDLVDQLKQEIAELGGPPTA